MIDGYRFVIWFYGQDEPTEIVERRMDRAVPMANQILADYAAGRCDCIAEQTGPLVTYTAVYHYPEDTKEEQT